MPGDLPTDAELEAVGPGVTPAVMDGHGGDFAKSTVLSQPSRRLQGGRCSVSVRWQS